MIGISAQTSYVDTFIATPDLQAIARATGAVGLDGEPLVYEVNDEGEGIDEEIVHGIEAVARDVPLDVDAVVLDEPGDDLDATIAGRQSFLPGVKSVSIRASGSRR